MSRILVLAAIAAVIYWLVISSRRRPSEGKEDGNSAEDTVRCAHCEVYLPKREGVSADGRYFCSEAHHRAFIDMTRRE